MLIEWSGIISYVAFLNGVIWFIFANFRLNSACSHIGVLNLWPACSMRAKWVVAKRTSQACRASKTTSVTCLATWFVNLQLLFSLPAYGVSRYAKTATSSVSLVQDIVPLQCTFHIYDKWQSNDALTIWPFSEEALLIVCFIFSRHLPNQPLLHFHSCCCSCPKCLPQYSSNNFLPRSCFLCMRPYFLPFCFVKFAFCQAEMRVLLIS